MTTDLEQGVHISIGELAARTGVAEATLRVWERRHGFPVPERLPSGHRRYDAEDVERVAQVARDRAAGLSVSAAIARARAAEAEPSLFAGIRRRRPDLQPVVLRKPLLLALTCAIEDESCARAERPLLFGSFQRERFYRRSERRWRDFARTAGLAVVFADFDRPRSPASGPVELPVDRSAPLTREWAVVCEAPGHAVCLTALELSGRFEVIWSVEPDVVRVAVEIFLGLLPPELAAGVAPAPVSGPPPDRQLRLATAITARAFARLG